MRLRCPVCHAEAALEAWAEDEAAREMMAILSALDATLGRPLVAYLGLWRSASRALAWERAVRIAREVLALEADAQRLAAALSQTVEQLRVKRDAGDVRPLTGHNYLKRVLEGMPQTAGALCVDAQPQRSAATRVQAKAHSATVDGVMRLEALKRRARGEAGHE
ncbi:hypothetical protein [Thiobacter aerophilum]|uniref:Uncharacterized protein n=1 Tax=Thiobacter aerophilum TaxID=3121275 RepID=A0ABV0EDM8_9BURK